MRSGISSIRSVTSSGRKWSPINKYA
jgi:hypothetical protein